MPTRQEQVIIDDVGTRLSLACDRHADAVMRVRDVLLQETDGEGIAAAVMAYLMIMMRLSGASSTEALGYVAHAVSRVYGADLDMSDQPKCTAKKPEGSN